jgi:hypothetical protein
MKFTNIISYLIIFLFLQNRIFCQRELVKQNKYVILKEDNFSKDTLISAPGKLIDFLIIDNQAVFLLDVWPIGVVSYDYFIFDGLGWVPQKTSCTLPGNLLTSSVPRTKVIYKSYKLEGINKVAMFEDDAFKGYYDFEAELKRKQAREMYLDSLGNARQLPQNNTKKD